jgi:hypothetical protein
MVINKNQFFRLHFVLRNEISNSERRYRKFKHVVNNEGAGNVVRVVSVNQRNHKYLTPWFVMELTGIGCSNIPWRM